MNANTEKEYHYSEIFDSIQGEGTYTGIKTLWLRFFLCNLQCRGFSQTDPTNPDGYDLPFEKFDPSTVKRVEDLPVWEKGCDSSYTWAAKFKHLMHKGTPEQICEKIVEYNTSEFNPEGKFLHARSAQRSHMCFTGGEPLMRHGQNCSVDMMKHFVASDNIPGSVTYESNGTQLLTPDFINYWKDQPPCELFFSVSPKLWTVAGEPATKAIKPEIVKQYHNLSKRGHLKFVLGKEQRQWDEMESVLKQFKDLGIDWPVFIMPVGAREEEQVADAKEVAIMALKRGYHVSPRVHVYLFGNAIGT